LNILGIHDGHSASAALIQEGKVVAAVQEERLTRHKNQGGFPENAIAEVLKIGGLTLQDLHAIAFSGLGKTNVKTREDIMKNFLRKIELPKKSPLSQAGKFLGSISLAETRKQLRLKRKQKERMNPLLEMDFPKKKISFLDHHLCHASAAYYGLGNMTDEILVLTVDAAGDSICATVSIGKNGVLKQLAAVPSSESAAILYSLITFLLGFVPLEHEYKLMGLAPYAEGSEKTRDVYAYFKSLFRFTPSLPLGWERNEGVEDTFRIGPELKKFIEYKRFDHLAGGLQLFIEDFFLHWIRRVIKETGVKKLALSGGLFMNVKLNKLVMELSEVDSIYVFPSCGDETNSIGAAWARYAEILQEKEAPITIPPLGHFYLGDSFTDSETQEILSAFHFKKNVRITEHKDIEKRCAELLAEGKVVARCKGRMEFGARALGNRSILSNPNHWGAVKIINEMIKMRDFWMPFAPSILAEYSDDYIVNPKKIQAPYMILAFDTKPGKLDKIIAATHPYDESCRPQLVDKAWNPDYHRLISYFKELTGEAAVLNTSFNLHGLPIVYKPAEALYVFDNSGLERLALGNLLIEEVK
jgi:carbamoyltransferase